MRIGKRALEQLKAAGPGAARSIVWDDELPGFGVRWGEGGGLSYVVKYRVKGIPKQHLVTLGTWPAVSPDAARERARTIKEAAAMRRDLLAEEETARQQAAAAAAEAARRHRTLGTFLDAWRAKTQVEAEAKEARDESARYERELLRLEARILRPALGALPIGEITGQRFQALIDSQASASTAGNLRGLIARVVSDVKAAMALEGAPLDWPDLYRLKRAIQPRGHRHTLEQCARIWIGAGTLGRRGALVRWLLLTGARRTEGGKTRRPHLHPSDPVAGPHWEQPWRLTKNGLPHRVPLTPPALAMLAWLPPRKTRRGEETDLVFAGRGNTKVGNWSDIAAALRRASGVTTGTFHDFRRSIVSALADRGFDPNVVDQLLNHAASSTMKGSMVVYQRSELWQQRREALKVWAELLMAEVSRITKQPQPQCWGFSQPFVDARISRVEHQAGGARPRVTGRISTASQASRSSGR